jgi:hypothetical protein
MNKRVIKLIAAGVGAAFVLTACAVSGRQIIMGPNGLTVQSFSLLPSQETVLPTVTEERATLPAAIVPDRVAEPAALPAPATGKHAEQVKAAEQAKTSKQVKTTEKATNSYKAHGCAGYGD